MSGLPVLPASLAERPLDSKTGFPIPFVNGFVDLVSGEEVGDFTAIQASRVIEAVTNRWCGLCGTPLEYWIAFIGGPKSFQGRTYLDPPMHPECAEFAVKTCPHISIQRHRRAPEERLSADTHVPNGFIEDKPSEWVVGITRDFSVRVLSGGGVVLIAAPWKRSRRYRYDETGVLVEIEP